MGEMLQAANELAADCGFAAGVANPFTVGVAPMLARLPMFSGVWLRLLSFACIYALLLAFVRPHAKRLSAGNRADPSTRLHEADIRMDRGLLLSQGLEDVGYGEWVIFMEISGVEFSADVYLRSHGKGTVEDRRLPRHLRVRMGHEKEKKCEYLLNVLRIVRSCIAEIFQDSLETGPVRNQGKPCQGGDVCHMHNYFLDTVPLLV